MICQRELNSILNGKYLSLPTAHLCSYLKAETCKKAAQPVRPLRTLSD